MLTFFLLVFIKSNIDPQGNKIEVFIGDSIKYTLQSAQEKYIFSKIFNQIKSILTHGFYLIKLTHNQQNTSYSLFIQSINHNSTEQFTTLENNEITTDDLDISYDKISENSNSNLDIINSTLDKSFNFSEELQEQEQSQSSNDISNDFHDQTKDFIEQSIYEQFSNTQNFTSNDPTNNNNHILIISLFGSFFFILIIIIFLLIFYCGCKKCDFKDRQSNDLFNSSSNDCSSNLKDIDEYSIKDLENIQANSQIDQCFTTDLEQKQIQQNDQQIIDNSDSSLSSTTSYLSSTTSYLSSTKSNNKDNTVNNTTTIEKNSKKIPVTINFNECSIFTSESGVIPKI